MKDLAKGEEALESVAVKELSFLTILNTSYDLVDIPKNAT